jgi:enoyl-[acyl-carrier protein] reductase II
MNNQNNEKQEKSKKHLMSLMARGCEFLGVETAILGGAMTWVSNASLVSAISNAGGFGVLACGAMPPAILDAEISKTKALTNKPFGVNLITLHPELDQLIEIVGANRVPIVVLAGGLPKSESIAKLKKFGCKVIGFAPARVIAQKLQRAHVDAIIIEGAEAGGHIGPVSTSVLAQEILPYIRDVPVFVAGGIGRGEAIVSYLQMGASGCQLGTRFVCAHESPAHENFKKAFIRGNARDAVASVQLDPRFPVIPVRALQNEASKKFMEAQAEIIAKVDRGEIDLKAGQLEIEHFWAGALRRAVTEGDIENGSLMAGQSVGMVTCEQSVSEIIQELMDQAVTYLMNQSAA